jgi:hypothetical protein
MMPGSGGHRPDSPNTDQQISGPVAPAEHAPHRLRIPGTEREISVGQRPGRVLVIIGAVAAAVLVAVGTGAITVPGAEGSAQGGQTSAQAALAAKRMAANQRWASATCTNLLDWKNAIQHDATSLNLGFGALARIQDAIAATTRMSTELKQLGLPPTVHTAQARAEINRLRSDLESRVHNIQGDAGSVASGNLAAIGGLLSDLETGTVVGTRIVSELRHVVSVDLGLSLVGTRACRQLVGIPI